MSAPQWKTESHALQQSARFQSAKRELLAAIAEASERVRGIRPPSTDAGIADAYRQAIQQFNRDRGRDLYYPFLSSGIGHGPFVELLDGSVKYDLITGIGINLLGHTHPALIAEMIDGLAADVQQGNLQPGHEASELIRAILKRVGSESRLKHGWLTTCGTMANEIALKMARQKRAPATKVLAFRDCFAGRSTAMQEITDNAKYREGQPLYGEAYYLPFYSRARGLQGSIDDTLAAMREHLHRYPGRFCAMMLELVQGEGGFNYAPREWYVAVFEEAKKHGIAIWADEIQTFGRTGELFAFQTLGLAPYIDLVTVAKALQSSVVLYTEEYNPKPGLVAGTFSGASMALRASRRVLELLDDGQLGKDGRIARLSARFQQRLQAIQEKKQGITEIRAIGGMIAFQPFGGSADEVKAVLMKLFELGVVAFNCGHGPYLVRMLPPLVAMSEQDVDRVGDIIEAALRDVAASTAAGREKKS